MLKNSSKLYVEKDMRQAIQVFAQQAAPQEACGLMLGFKSDHSLHIVRAIKSPNMSQDPLIGFLIHPKLQFRLTRFLRQTHLAVVGVFHSHPTGDVAPSATDVAMGSGDGLVWSITDGTGSKLRHFSLEKNGQVVEYSKVCYC